MVTTAALLLWLETAPVPARRERVRPAFLQSLVRPRRIHPELEETYRAACELAQNPAVPRAARKRAAQIARSILRSMK